MPERTDPQFYRNVLESFDIDIAIFDRDCRYVYVNPHAVRDPAVREWMIGKNDAEYCAYRGRDPEIGRERMRQLATVLETGEIATFEEALSTPAGDIKHIIRRICPVYDERGEVRQLIGYGYDITELRRAQKSVVAHQQERQHAARAIEESALRFRLLTKATNDVIWDWDIVNQQVWWSDAVETKFAHSRAKLGNAVSSWSDNLHPDDLERVWERTRIAMDLGDNEWQCEYRFRRGDGEYATVYDRAYILYGDDGRAVRMIGAMQDITERLALESQLRQAQKMEAVGQLAAGVAHDFNNLLTAINSYAELAMLELDVKSGVVTDIAEIQRATLRGRELTRHLLAFSRKDASHPVVIDLNRVVTETVGLLRPIFGERIRIDMDLDRRACAVLADAGQLTQLLMNLGVNGRDAMLPEGGVLTISTRLLPRANLQRAPQAIAPAYVELVVRDTGRGIEANVLPRIFEPFFTTKPVGEGSGLGLATVYGIVTGAAGIVWAESEPGRGSVFTVLFPQAMGTPASLEPAQERRDSHGGRRVILLVEDETPVRASIARLLSKRGYDVLEAADATEALEAFRAHSRHIAAIVSDVVMPAMSGPELVRTIRRSRPALPVLFISGYTGSATGLAEVLDSNTRFLAKPFRFPELLEILSELLEQHASDVSSAV